MHYHVVVLLDSETELTKEAVASLMEPHEEWFNEETEASGGYWDWWRVGGRWDGALWPKVEDKHTCADFHCGYSPFHEQIERNSREVSDLPEGVEKRIHAIVTPSGQWLEGVNIWEHPEFPGFPARDGDRTVYDTLSDQLERDWQCQVRRVLVGHNACTAVSVDLHS